LQASLTGAPIGLYQLAEELAKCGAAITILSLKAGPLRTPSGVEMLQSSQGLDVTQYDVILVNTVSVHSADFVHQQVIL